MNGQHSLLVGRGTDLRETTALLALLKLSPKGTSWGEIAGEVRAVGSATMVLEDLAAVSGALLPDPRTESALAWARASVAEWWGQGLRMVTILSDQYPAALSGVFDSPPFLFVEGEVAAREPAMSVVGSRKPSASGVDFAQIAAELLVESGVTVLSGLAQGIDTAAHRRALELGGKTTAVLGTGITQNYPTSNRELQREIAAKGLVLSQFYPDQPPTRQTFPMRNAVMSGLGMATIVVEASEHSGTRIQARLAGDHGRPVILSADVVQSTSWGHRMQDDPWVRVVSTRRQLADAIDEFRTDRPQNTFAGLGVAR